MEANANDVAEQKDWDVQTFDNLIDNVCNARETYLSRNCKGVYAIVEGKIEKTRYDDSLSIVTDYFPIPISFPFIIRVIQTNT